MSLFPNGVWDFMTAIHYYYCYYWNAQLMVKYMPCLWSLSQDRRRNNLVDVSFSRRAWSWRSFVEICGKTRSRLLTCLYVSGCELDLTELFSGCGENKTKCVFESFWEETTSLVTAVVKIST